MRTQFHSSAIPRMSQTIPFHIIISHCFVSIAVAHDPIVLRRNNLVPNREQFVPLSYATISSINPIDLTTLKQYPFAVRRWASASWAAIYSSPSDLQKPTFAWNTMAFSWHHIIKYKFDFQFFLLILTLTLSWNSFCSV